MTDTQIWIAIITAVGGIVVALVGLTGRSKEVSATEMAALITGQAERIDRLESRLDKVEKELSKTKHSLWQYKTHAIELRKALAGALAWIADAVEWINSDREDEPPVPPNSDAWLSLIDTTLDE